MWYNPRRFFKFDKMEGVHTMFRHRAKSVIRAAVAALTVCAAVNGVCGDVANADFEMRDAAGGAVAWVLPPATGWRMADGEGVNGTRALCYDGDMGAKKRGIAFQYVEIDRSKKYLMEAWVRTVGISSGGASICIQCHDKDGNVFYGKYSHDRIIGNTDGWVRISDVTGAGQFPDKAVKLSLCLFVQGTPKGKAYFDNVRLVPYDLAKAPVAGLYSSVYRDSASEGDVTFHAALNLSQKDFEAKRPCASICYTDAFGGRVCRRAECLSRDEASVSLKVTDLALGTNCVEFSLREAAGELIGKTTLDFTRTEKPVRRRVWIDRYNRTIVNGRPFFPLGAYVNHIDWHGETNFSVYCQAPFNCVLPYALPQNKECLDLCQKTNLMVIASLYHVWAGTRSAWVKAEAEEEPFLRKAAALCADHPALLAWYLYDELPAAMLPRMAKRLKLMWKIDPDHPTLGCVCSVDEMRDYVPTFDVVGSDPYPIGREQIKALPISLAADWTRKTRRGTFGARAMWQIPQMFDWDWFRKEGNPKFPTYDEFRNMSYQCIAEGANGLIYFHFTRFLMCDDRFGEHWPYVCAALREIAAGIPVFLLDPGPVPVSAPNADMSLRTWRDGDSVWALAVNATRSPLAAEVRFKEPLGNIVEARFGTTPNMDGATVRFDLAPLESTLFRVSSE